MADELTGVPAPGPSDASEPWRMGVEEAREHAKARFRERLANGEQVGNCSCTSEGPADAADGEGSRVVGVRFRDSGRVYFFETDDSSLAVGSWVACTTSRGQEAGRVVVAPHQLLASQLDGTLKPIDRVLDDEDIARIEQHRKDASRVIRRAGELSRYYDFGVKAIAAEYSLDGQSIELSYSASDHSFVEDLADMLARDIGASVQMRQVGPREEARLIGGLGKCGRTLCCSSWLPYYPDVSMGMAKNQDLSLNPSKVSGLCGRLLCCLSYENEQYRKAKQLLPRLGQRIATPDGEGMVVSLQVIKELVTVRYAEPFREQTWPAAELLAPRVVQAVTVDTAATADTAAPADGHAAMDVPVQGSDEDRRPRRRRRRRTRRAQDGQD